MFFLGGGVSYRRKHLKEIFWIVPLIEQIKSSGIETECTVAALYILFLFVVQFMDELQ